MLLNFRRFLKQQEQKLFPESFSRPMTPNNELPQSKLKSLDTFWTNERQVKKDKLTCCDVW